MSTRKAREKTSALSNVNVAPTPAAPSAAAIKEKGAPPPGDVEVVQNKELVPGKITERDW